MKDTLVAPLLEFCIKLLEARARFVEELKGVEATTPLLIFEIIVDDLDGRKSVVDVEIDAVEADISDTAPTFSAFRVFLSSLLSDSKHLCCVSLAKLH